MTNTPSNAALAKAAEIILQTLGYGGGDALALHIATALSKYGLLRPDAPDVRTAEGWLPIERATPEFQSRADVCARNIRLGDLCYQVVFHDTKEALWAVVHFSNPAPCRPIEYFPLPYPERPAPASAAPIKTDHELEFAVASIWVALDRPNNSDGVPDDTIARPLAVAIVDRVRNPFSASAAPSEPMDTDMFGRTSWEADEDNIWEDPNMGDQ